MAALFGPTKLSQRQQGVILLLLRQHTITLDDVASMGEGGNPDKRASETVGPTLSVMVKRGLIERIKPGVFRMAGRKGEGGESTEEDEMT